jgi:hypothetical protein
MDPDITFTYDEKKYSVASKAYDLNLIVLPDGRAIEAEGWLESYPPKPSNLKEVNHLFKNFKPEEIAEKLNGVVAVLA